MDDLTDELVAEIETGVGDSGVRPGIIGEIGTDKPWVSPAEERVHRAAARAARRTGLAITTHGVLSDVGLAQLRILEEEGVDPGRVVIGPPTYPFMTTTAIIERARARVRLHRHAVGRERLTEPRLVEARLRAARSRPADRLFLSQDVCADRSPLRHSVATATLPCRSSCRFCGPPECRTRIDTMSGRPRRS